MRRKSGIESYQMFRESGISLTPGVGQPLYRQIFDQVAARVSSGVLTPGFRLPPTRVLAEELGVHRNTVVRAFEDLVAAGFLVSVVGRGSFVTSAPLPASISPPPSRPSLPWVSLVSRAASAEPLGRADALAGPAPSGNPVNLSRMEPAGELLPHELLRRCLDHVLRDRAASALGYSPREGLPRLRELIAAELSRSGVPAEVDDVLVTTGSQQALDLVARALIDPGDPFLVEESTYSGAINLFAVAGARVVGVPSDGDGPDPAALERHDRSRAKGFYMMPNCGNPTGACVSAERRHALVAWSRRAGVPLIEDDYGADLNLDGVPPPPALKALDSEVIYLGTFSKKLIPALRVGFLVCPKALRRQLVPLKHAMDLGTSVLLQHALCEFLERGYMRAHLAKVLPEYRARRDALAAGLSEGLPDGVEWTPPARGLVLWLQLPEGSDPGAVCEEASRRGVLVTPGAIYSPTGRSRPSLRLAFCGEPPERIAVGAQRLCRAIDAAAGRGRGSGSTRAPAIDVL